MAGRGAMSISEFLAHLGQRIDQLGPAGVRAAVEAHARSLRPSQRAAFLDIFAGSEAPAGAADDLLAEIERMRGELADLEPAPWRGYRRWEDDDDDDEYGVESAEIDGLLMETGVRFLAGDVETAAMAYDRVLDAVVQTLDDDRGISLAPDAELVAEAFARLLWHRAASASEGFAESLDTYRILTPVPSLSTILGAHPDLGPPPDDALRTVADGLLAAGSAGPEWETRTRLALALEMVSHLDGVDAVVALARTESPHRLGTARWVVERLVDDGRPGDAADLAHSTMDSTGNSPALAELADTAAALDAQLGRPAFLAASRAWRSDATATRLEIVLDAASVAERQQFIADESEDPPGDRFLSTALSVLAGDVREAATRAIGGASWDPARGSVHLAVAACCAVAGSPPPPGVRAAVATACSAGDRRRPRSLLADVQPSSTTPLADRLWDALAAVDVDRAYLGVAKGLVHDTAEEILGAKERSSYSVAAALIVLLAAATEAVEGTSAADVTSQFEQRYNRFSAFRKELRAARSAAR